LLTGIDQPDHRNAKLARRSATSAPTLLRWGAFRDFLKSSEMREGKLMLRAIVTATAIGLSVPSYAQVKVITGDTERTYGPGGKLLHTQQLKPNNQRSPSRQPGAAEQRLSVQQGGQPPKSFWE